jgi:GTPase SAR1 family protein
MKKISFKDLLPIFATLVTVSTVFILSDLFRSVSSSLVGMISLVVALSSLIVSLGFTYVTLSNRLPVAHNVAVIGFPRSGKTTLITSLFGEIFAQRVLGVQATPTGATTIERINADLAKLEMGHALGPTTDQDLFAYRTNVTTKGFLLPRSYKVEFGDFPGEDSAQYTKNFGPWFHTTPFFKWVVDADAYIFVIDLAKYLNPADQKNYIAEMSSAIRAAWQNLSDNIEGGSKAIKNRPAVLVFTKADIFDNLPISISLLLNTQSSEDLVERESIKEAILKAGFGNDLPPVQKINTDLLDAERQKVEHDFADLINFLGSESARFHILYTSCVGTVHGLRLGVSRLLELVLPG